MTSANVRIHAGAGAADGPGGVYLLRIAVGRDLYVAFGRFRGGRPLPVPAGEYLYVGSALGRAGANALAGRLLRHATRSGPRPPHAIREAIAARFAVAPARLPSAKRLRWHIDYLLDQTAAEIVHVDVIPTVLPLEGALADRLAAAPGVAPLAPGLGASDVPGRTHLLRLMDASAGDRSREQAAIAAIIGSVQQDVISQKLQALDESLAELRSLGELAAADLSADWRLQRAVERDVLILTDVAVEVSQRLAAGAGSSRARVPSAADAMARCIQTGVLSPGDGAIRMVRLGSYPAYRYERIPPEELAAVVNDHLADFERFRDDVLAYVGRSG